MQKVNVATVDDVKISRWRWWSNWIDVCVVQHGRQGYLLQMAVSRTNAKKFKLIAFKAFYNVADCGASVGDLTQMRGEKFLSNLDATMTASSMITHGCKSVDIDLIEPVEASKCAT